MCTMTEQYNGQTYLEYANRAAVKIREISKLVCGTSMPEEGSLLEEVDYCLYIMIQMYLAPIVEKRIESDELNNMAVELMSAEKDEISSIIKKYCNKLHSL